MRKFSICVQLLACTAFPALADNNPFLTEPSLYEGPYRATVVRVVDADTIEVSVEIWPKLLQTATLRLRGVDAPESKSTCESEKAVGLEAAAWVRKTYPTGEIIRIDNIEFGTLSRFTADVKRWRSDRWLALTDELLEREYAEIWAPGQQAIPWCLLTQERAMRDVVPCK